MRNLSQIFAAALSLIIATGPGLTHAANVAAVRTVRIPVQAPGAAGVGMLGAQGLKLTVAPQLTLPGTLPLSTLNTLPSVSPSARVSANPQAAVISPNAAVSATSEQGQSARALGETPQALVGQVGNPKQARAPSVRKALRTFAKVLTPRIGSAAPAQAVASSRAFDNAAPHKTYAGSAVQGRFAAAQSHASGLQSGEESADGDFSATELPEPEAAPAKKSSIWRSIRIGWMSAIGMLFLYASVDVVAYLVGYQFTPSYAMPEVDGNAPQVIGTALNTFMAAVMAPLNEEVYFRAGLMGMLAMGATSSLAMLHRLALWMTKRWEGVHQRVTNAKRYFNTATFLYSGIITAVLFVILHETSDPVLLATRTLQALGMSYLFAREGILSAIFHHGFFNLLAGTLFVSMIALPSGAIAIAIVPALFLFAGYGLVLLSSYLRTRGTFAKEKREIQAGVRTAYRLSARAATVLGVVSLIATALVGYPGLLWESGMLLGMAIQMLPAAAAFLVYASSVRDYEKSYGAQRLREKVTQPAEKYSMFNMPGLVAAIKTYLGLLAVLLGLGFGMAGTMPYIPAVLGGLALAMLGVRAIAKKFAWKSVWGVVYTILIAGALGFLAAPYAEPVMVIIQEMAEALQAAKGGG
jgi:hypothetical protein